MRARMTMGSILAWAALSACTHVPAPGDSPVPAVAAQGASSAPGRLVQLEAIFWACDYLATTRGMDATPIRECAAATRELRHVKFDGSFRRMLDWWREHKPAEHGRRAAERGEAR